MARPAALLRAAACAWLFLLALLAVPARAQQDGKEQAGQVVVKILVRGNKTVSEEFVKRQLKTREGKPFNPEDLNDDIKRLFKQGLFSNIETVREVVPGGLRITFQVVENLTVGEIRFQGIERLDMDEVKAALRLKAGRPYSEYLAQLDRERLLSMYRSEGYPFATVEVQTQGAPPSVDLLFKAAEGPRVGVDKIRFVGHRTFSASKLKDAMKTEESGWFTTGKYDEEVFQQDLVSLLSFYRGKGFLDALVALGDVQYSPDKKKLVLEIHVEEGPRFKVDKVEFEGNRLFTTPELASRITAKPGEWYDEEKVVADRRRIEELYADNARIHAQVTPSRIYAPAGQALSLVYQISEARRVHIQRIRIEGNLTTRDDVIRRELLVHPGDPFNFTRLKNSRQRLQNLGYFDAVTLDILEAEDKSPADRDVVVRLKEGRTGTLRFAIGVTSNAGVVGEVSLTKKNFDIARLPRSWEDFVSGNAFTGGGQELSLQWQPGTQLNRYRALFREPHLAGSPYSMELEAQHYSRKRETFDEVRTGGAVTFGRQIDLEKYVDLTYRAERVRVDDVDDDAPSIVKRVEGNNLLSSVTYGFQMDTRDDPVAPGKGWHGGISHELAGTAFGGDFDYSKVNLKGGWFKSLWKPWQELPHIVSVTGRLGLGYEHGTEIPVFSRYFAGGQGSVRGFKFRTISPKEGDEPTGGNFLATLNLEYSVPVYKETLRLVVFTDFGNVTNELSDLSRGARASAGIGVRVKIPFLGPRPIAVDLGFPLAKEDDDEREIVSFSFGRSF